MATGPFDGRVKRTRCTACIRGHLRCAGGIPCKGCVRTQQMCNAPKADRAIKFVDTIIGSSGSPDRRTRMGDRISHSISPDAPSRYITHFHTSFLRSNSLTGGFFEQFQDVNPLLRNSPALQNAIMAVSALDLEKRSNQPPKPAADSALKYYRAGISFVRTDLERPDLRTDPSVLWSTFFLGMFELMCDSSGEGWIKHFLYGTSALLQYRGPAAHLTGAGRRFFLTIRVFEISRALIYSSESFLARAEWCGLMKNMWLGKQMEDWHPKEALFDIMMACSTLSMRAMKFLLSMPNYPAIADEDILRELAQDGLLLQSALSAWKLSAHKWSTGKLNSSEDAQMVIALVYYHAISIYLSGTFDYHKHWTDRNCLTPTLSSSEIQAHVSAILDMVGSALKQGVLAGILFFFPLRVAGARTTTLGGKREICRLLQLITKRGFVVADAFETDLKELWDSRLAA